MLEFVQEFRPQILYEIPLSTSMRTRVCQFHFRRAVCTKLSNLGLQSFYNGNVEFNELVHRVYALSFVPPTSLVQFYEDFVVLYIEERLDGTAGTGNPTWIEGTDML